MNCDVSPHTLIIINRQSLYVREANDDVVEQLFRGPVAELFQDVSA